MHFETITFHNYPASLPPEVTPILVKYDCPNQPNSVFNGLCKPCLYVVTSSGYELFTCILTGLEIVGVKSWAEFPKND